MPGGFKCTTGDADFYFRHRKKLYRVSEVERIFRERIKSGCLHCSTPWDVFPGLVLEDEDGRKFKAELTITLEPEED